jgi:hypothetical protein
MPTGRRGAAVGPEWSRRVGRVARTPTVPSSSSGEERERCAAGLRAVLVMLWCSVPRSRSTSTHTSMASVEPRTAASVRIIRDTVSMPVATGGGSLVADFAGNEVLAGGGQYLTPRVVRRPVPLFARTSTLSPDELSHERSRPGREREHA